MKIVAYLDDALYSESEAVEGIWPGGVLSTWDEALGIVQMDLAWQVETLVAWRYHFAESGAMRWPWSQEAPCHVRSAYVFGEFDPTPKWEAARR